MRILIALWVALVATPAGAAEVGALLLGVDARLEPSALGGFESDVGFGLDGLVTRWRPGCAGLRIGLDPDSDGEGSSAVRSLEVPLSLRGGVCGGRRAVFFGWVGAGMSLAIVTTEVAGVSRTDVAPLSILAGGVDVVGRMGRIAALAGLSAELVGDRWAAVLRFGLGGFGP
jgi:hypothetical protein